MNDEFVLIDEIKKKIDELTELSPDDEDVWAALSNIRVALANYCMARVVYCDKAIKEMNNESKECRDR